jgi:hypothetical protein
MGIAIVIASFLAGGITSTVVFWQVLPERLKHHIDYKQRWEGAVSLLGAQGQLTDEQVRQIRGYDQQPPPSPVPGTAKPGTSTGPSAATLRTLHSMASWDRKDAEILRARKGLPPLDDLIGMASWDIKAVLNERDS